MTEQNVHCPHCDSELRPFAIPSDSGYDGPFHLACFNDDCSYYQEGWDWMWEQYAVKASYRYRVNPQTGVASPIPVWSGEALISRIVSGPHTIKSLRDG